MRTFGWIILIIAAIMAISALNMDTSVATDGAFGGRVNNIGLMNDKQNYLMISGVGILAGLLMIIFGKSAEEKFVAERQMPQSTDPFDEIDVETLNKRKRYAIELGVKRRDGIYQYQGSDYPDLESAISAAGGGASKQPLV